MATLIPGSVMSEFKKNLRMMKSIGRLEKGYLTARQTVYMHVAAKMGPRWLRENGPSLKAELDAAIEEVRNEN